MKITLLSVCPSLVLFYTSPCDSISFLSFSAYSSGLVRALTHHLGITVAFRVKDIADIYINVYHIFLNEKLA